ncbi:DUF4198 domain-containing protein [Hymenobacter sp. ISL-91]|uniref:DUF4198 domain-containing protein n=1 Tax=Hymenobacter sp. ISL-91 TaxID=2819151 RepID=UPI001BE6B203|nr:DUF4198 domain-containing protein [Hymenobacter sp. ISL-91]MBT2559427.1 DUF4198 domain-containing protein [Hymenobacter sp. ISL-91]
MKTLFAFLLLAATYLLPGLSAASAHAVWIESITKATKNKAHGVKIYYGDYPEGVIEPTQKWYSDLKTLEVWVVSPSGKKTQLPLTDAATHLTASFTPTEDGLYHLTTVHVTKELGGTTKYEFSSVAPVLAGSATTTTTTAAAAPQVPLSIVTAPKSHRVNTPVEVQVRKDGQPFQDGKVELMSPEGWVKTMKTDANGKLVFTPQLKGSYVLEASDYQAQTGEWNQQNHTHFWQGATTHIVVN